MREFIQQHGRNEDGIRILPVEADFAKRHRLPSVATTMRRFAIALPLYVCAMAADAGLLFLGDFETGKIASPNSNPDGFWPNMVDNDLGVKRDVVRSGAYSAGCTLYKSKDYTVMSNGQLNNDKPRCDLVKGAINFDYNKDYWVGFSIFLPQDWIDDYKDNRDTLAQVHGVSGGPPVIELEIEGGNWRIRDRWDPNSETEILGQTTTKNLFVGSTSSDKGTWTDWVYHVKLCSQVGCNGLIEVWKNGKQVVNYSGPNALKLPSSGVGPIFQVDLYKYAWKKNASLVPSTRTVWWDEIRIGNSQSNFSEVSPSGSSTLAAPATPSGISLQIITQ